MPNPGDIGRNETGHLLIYAPCEDCGELRWVSCKDWQPKYERCKSCSKKGRRSNAWKGGVIIERGNYLARYLFPDDPFFPMAKKSGYVFEHRYEMAKYLGRCLTRSEVVHHKNGDRRDNRLENLELVESGRHEIITALENRVRYLESRVTILEAEVTLSKQEVLPCLNQR